MTLHFLPPATDAYDAAVEDAIATCSGDLRGALKALIIADGIQRWPPRPQRCQEKRSSRLGPQRISVN
jgi:hypothetical protein